jgi:hypothetical protein
MNDQPPLHSSIVAMVSLAAGIASKHPAMGLCQLQRLRDYGVPEHQIATVIEIARHIRNEAAEKLDVEFDAKSTQAKNNIPVMAAESEGGCGCSTTSSGQSCC